MYKRVGDVDVTGLAELAQQFPISDSSLYDLVDGRLLPVEEAFRPYLGHMFPGEWKFCFLVILEQGGSIEPHKDKDELPRYHIVLATNDKSWSYHEGDWQQLELGGVYRMDPRGTHASINWGTKRIHLIIDTEEFHD